MNTYTLYREYSESAIVGNDSLCVVYDGPDVRIIGTDCGMHLVTRIDPAPSWFSFIPHEFPYLFSTDHLNWYSELEHWKISMFRLDGHKCEMSRSMRSMHLFARRTETEMFRYLGAGINVTYGPCEPTDSKTILLRYHINPKLARADWVYFGGYAGWLLILGRREFTPSSGEAAASLIESQWGSSCPFLVLTRYEGDILQASTDEQGQAIMSYSRNPTTATQFSGRYDSMGEWVCFPGENGDDWEAPVSTVIDRHDALSIIGTYLSTGCPSGLSGAD